MFKTIIARLKRTFKSEEASITVEAVVVVPFLVLLTVGMWVIYDAVRQQSVNYKATYTINDLMARERSSITHDYLRSMLRLYNLLDNYVEGHTPSKDSRYISFSQVTWREALGRYDVVWSRKRSHLDDNINDDEIQLATSDLPILGNCEMLLLITSHKAYSDPMNLGLLPEGINTYAFSKLRYSPFLVFERNDGTTVHYPACGF